MTGTYDIFRDFPKGGPIWVEVVQGLENARARLTKLCESSPGEYFIFDSTAAKIVEKVPYPSQSSKAADPSKNRRFRFLLPRRLQTSH